MLRWSTPVQLLPEREQIRPGQHMLLTGSCFTTHMGHKLQSVGWNVAVNPAGVLYNPMSMEIQLRRWMSDLQPKQEELFFHEGLYRHPDWHSSFAADSEELAMSNLIRSVEAGKAGLGSAEWLILTPGTARVYHRISDGRLMANNHKLPSALLQDRMLSSQEIVQAWSRLMTEILEQRPSLRVIMTVSPVRHIRDGLVVNGQSKAILVSALHELAASFDQLTYFPSYEIMMDELRDYRFYEADLIHPNQVAIEHIWDQFQQVCMSAESRQQVLDITQYRSMLEHRIMHPGSSTAIQFESKLQAVRTELERKYPGVNWKEFS